jgi:hypothetical protein
MGPVILALKLIPYTPTTGSGACCWADVGATTKAILPAGRPQASNQDAGHLVAGVCYVQGKIQTEERYNGPYN